MADHLRRRPPRSARHNLNSNNNKAGTSKGLVGTLLYPRVNRRCPHSRRQEEGQHSHSHPWEANMLWVASNSPKWGLGVFPLPRRQR